MNFKPLNIKKFQKTSKVVTPDSAYWRSLSVPTLVKEFGAIDYIDFSPIEPHNFAATCSVRVQIYNPITKLVVKALTRFQEPAYGGTFRKDGRLLAAGDEQGFIKLFDTSSKNVLRMFKGHKAAVHRAFFTTDLLHIASFCDDQTVKLWDIASEKTLHTYAAAHDDYIRAGAISPVSADILLSGGYDGKIKLYDTRTKEQLRTVDHGSPVESLLFLPTGGIFVSAGGTEVRVWDIFGGCRLLCQLSQHHKTVTCLRLGSNGKRILSSGLDRHVKIYDVASYQPVHTLNFPSAVLSLGVAANDNTVVAGMVDGLISIQNMESVDKKVATNEQIKHRSQQYANSRADHVIECPTRIKQSRYNVHLRKFEYVRCLDLVMKRSICFKTPEVTVSVMQELLHRKGLHRALEARTHAFLSRVINFIHRYIGEHRFLRVLIDVTNTLLDVYEDSFQEFSSDLVKEFLGLAHALQKETELSYDLLELKGELDMLTSAASAGTEADTMFSFMPESNPSLEPSRLAKEPFILSI